MGVRFFSWALIMKIILMPKYKIAFIDVAKAGSSTLKDIAVDTCYPECKDLKDRYGVHLYMQHGFKYPFNPTITDCAEEIKDEYKFYMFVRNQYSRIYSSFIHYLVEAGPYADRHQPCIYIKNVGTFDTLLNTTAIDEMNKVDIHFYSFRRILSAFPPDIDLTFCHFENFEKELRNIFNNVGCDAHIPHKNPKKNKIEYTEAYNMKLKLRFLDIYRWDMTHFNYTFDSYGPLPTYEEIYKFI